MKMTNSRRASRGASIIDARAHYWAAARRLRSIGLEYRTMDEVHETSDSECCIRTIVRTI
jgi:hypothetical protein